MRSAYREHLDAFAHDLIVLCDCVQTILRQGSRALFQADLGAAEQALSLTDELDEIQKRCEERAVALLALEGPLARDLRQIISSIYIVEDLNRMGMLGVHIARTARRRHPEHAIPAALVGYFEEMSRLDLELGAKVRELLIDPDADVAVALSDDDDAVDDLHQHLFRVLTRREWPYTTTQAVDATLLSRFFERYADHAVNVAARIVYLSSGLMPAEYLARRSEEEAEAEMQRRFAEIERRFAR